MSVSTAAAIPSGTAQSIVSPYCICGERFTCVCGELFLARVARLLRFHAPKPTHAVLGESRDSVVRARRARKLSSANPTFRERCYKLGHQRLPAKKTQRTAQKILSGSTQTRVTCTASSLRSFLCAISAHESLTPALLAHIYCVRACLLAT